MNESRPRILFGKNIKNLNIENQHAHQQTKEEQYIFENSAVESQLMESAFSDDQNFDAGKIIHAAVHISSSHQPPPTLENDRQTNENYHSRLEDWNEEENEIALTALILQHKQNLLELWKIVNGFDETLQVGLPLSTSAEMDFVDDPRIPVRIQFLAHAFARRRIIKSVHTISNWWHLIRSSVTQ